MCPNAIYIMLPLEPGDEIDVRQRRRDTFPNGDETRNSDGWAAFSGTSAAAPQLAGAAALVKQACPALTPAQIQSIMMKTARDVTTGKSTPGARRQAAVVGPDLATGNGLVDANKSVMLAKVQCLGPIAADRADPPDPTDPADPADQADRADPADPADRADPTDSNRFSPSSQPGDSGPADHADSADRNPGPGPGGGGMSASASSAAPAASSLSDEDVEALQEMIANSDIEL